MNKTPKFRVWDKQNKRMYPTDYELIKEIHFTENGEIDKVVIAAFLPNGSWAFKFLEDVEYMRNTGLKDKNREVIYEGDIVKDKDDNIYYIKWSNTVCNDLSFETFCLFNPKDNLEFPYVLNNVEVFEIIGNVYTNPEILK